MKLHRILPSVIAMTFLAVAILQPPSLAVASTSNSAVTKAATPAFSPAPGTYGWDQSVKITDATAGATIYYTTNGKTPTTSSTKYKSPIVVSKTQTIEAIAVASGHSESAVAKGAYTITDSLDVIIATASGKNVITVPVGGTEAFAVFAKNIGKQSDPNITVTTINTPSTLPVTVTLCETNPNNGACFAAPAHSVSIATLSGGADRTFAVFVEAHGSIANSPTANRITVQFKNAFGSVESSGSVAVYTTK
jgi:hypothetical protein